jgi:hypothetical protein
MAENRTEPQDQRLSSLFNSFAAKAVDDFPQLRKNFVIYSKPTNDFFGSLPENIDASMKQVVIDFAASRPKLGGEAGFIGDIPMIVIHETGIEEGASKRFSFWDAPVEQNFKRFLRHELGHHIVPAGISEKTGLPNRAESGADVFSFFGDFEHKGQLADASWKDVTQWGRTVEFFFGYPHYYTVPALQAAQELSERHDICELSPLEKANAAYRIALTSGFSDKKLEDVHSSIFKENGQYSFMEICTFVGEAMLADHGELTDDVRVACKTMLRPILDKNEKATKTIFGQGFEGCDFSTPFWDGVRKKITAHDHQITPAQSPVDIEARDMLVLGYFDATTPDNIIDPVFYESEDNRMNLEYAQITYKRLRQQQLEGDTSRLAEMTPRQLARLCARIVHQPVDDETVPVPKTPSP